MIGIRFEIPNNYGNYLRDILKNLNLENYYWNIFDSEILDKKGNNLFSDNNYNIKMEDIFNNKDYYLIFANFQGYQNKNNFNNITSYTDFLKSDCEIIIIVVDSIYIDIFIKNLEVLQLIKKNVYDNKYSNVKILYNLNDTFRAFKSIE